MKVSIRLLGDFTMAIDGRDPDVTGLSRRPRELVQLMALSPGHRVNRDRVIEQLFGHLGPEAGASNLHKAASLARRHLGDPAAVTIRDGWVSLWPGETVEIDVEHFEADARAALRSEEVGACRRAADGYPGDLLPGSLHEEWALEPRRRLRLLYLELLRRAEDWERLGEAEPTDEEATRWLMRDAATRGDRAAVVERFRRLRDALAREMAMSPSLDTVALYEELTHGPAVVAPVTRRTPLVGRGRLLSTAMDLMETTAQGAGGGVLVRGEAGIGKTRFCEELLTRAAEDGWTTLRGSGSRVGAGIPFLPVAEAIDRLVEERPGLVDRLPAPARAALARVTVAALRTTEAAPDQLGPQRVVSAVARLVAAAARERPVMLFFDDLQSADVDTIRLVHHLMRSAIFQPVLVIAAFRAGEETPPAAELRRELLASGRVSEIEVPPLEVEAAAELIAERSERGVAADQVASMWQRAGGNPFFLGELAAHIDDRDGPPESVTAAVAARLVRVAPGHRPVLELVAVVGEWFTSTELAALAGLEPDEANSLLDDALTAEILEETEGRLRFRHPLVQEALVENLPDHRLSAAHLAAAHMSEITGAGPARVAHHLLAAGRPAEARPWLMKAALDAASIGAFSDAAGLLDQARSNGGRDPEMLRFRAELAYATADADAPRMYTEAIAASPPSEAAALLIRRAGAFVAANEPGPAAASLAAVGQVSDDDLALLQLTNSQVTWMTGDLESAMDWAESARHTALSRGQMEVVMGAISMLDLILHQRGGWADRFRHDLIRAEDSPLLATLLYDAHLCGAEMYLYGGRPYSELAEFARDLADRARRGGAKRGLAFAETLLGEVALLSGDLDMAETHLSIGAELHRQIGSPGGEALAKQRLAQTLIADTRSGDEDRDVAALLSDALTLAGSAGAMAWHVVARVYATMIDSAPDSETALTVVDQAEADIGGGMAKACPSCSVPYWIAAAVACADAGRVSDAKRFVARAEPRVAAVWPKGGWEAALDEARGHISLTEGDLGAARSLLEQAKAGFERVGQVLDMARCEETLARLTD